MRRQLTTHQKTIFRHLKKIQTMVNAPSLKKKIPPNQEESDDDDFYDDYILDENSSESEDEYEMTILRKKPERRAKLTDILYLPECQVKKNDEICSICLQGLEKDQKHRMLPCTHKYHFSCIRDWLLIKNKCPACNCIVFQ